MTVFSSYSDDGLNAAIGIQQTSVKSEGEMVTLFGGYSYEGLNAAIGVQHTEVPNQGASW